MLNKFLNPETSKMFITIDPYYDVERYNESLQALMNNGVKFEEYISTRTPYNWYLKLDTAPIMMNYDILTKDIKKFLVRKTLPLQTNDEIKLFRRNQYFSHYTSNDALSTFKDYGVFFTLKNSESVIGLSKKIPLKIWYFGRYYNNRYNVYFCNSPLVKTFLVETDTKIKDINSLECELNYKIFLGKDFLKKYTETPYYLEGQFYKPSVTNGLNLKL